MLEDWQEVGLWGRVLHHIGQEMVDLIHISAEVRLRGYTIASETRDVSAALPNLSTNSWCCILVNILYFLWIAVGFPSNHNILISTTPSPDRRHCIRAHRDKIPLIHFASGELKQCKQPTRGWILAMKGMLPLVLLSLWAPNNARGELITWKKLQLWTLQEVRESTWPRSVFTLEMARALKSEKFMLLNFQKVSIMCPCSLSLSGEDVLMAVTSKTEPWQKQYLRLALFL